MRTKIAISYTADWLETDRPQPLTDTTIEHMIQDVLSGKLDSDITDEVYINFKAEMSTWVFNSKLNKLTGIEAFDRVDIVNGCTQYIDTLYMNGVLQVIEGDYKYHERLKLYWDKREAGMLAKDVPLVIAMPFPRIGAPHIQMKEILDECLEKNIPLHIDGAWVTCCRDVEFDFSHPAIHSVGISLSKGLGLGWNRIGLRWTRNVKPDSVTIMNDFRMNLRAPAMIGLHFVRNLPPDYLWNKYGDMYYQICNDFNLTPTKSIYLALNNDQPVGLSPLIRYVAQQ